MLLTFRYLWNGFNWHFKKFNSISFKMNLLKDLSLNELQKGDFNKFKFLVNKLLEFHLTWKKNVRNVCKAIVVRTCLLNRFRKENLFLDELAYKRQRNFCVKPIKKTKRNFYNNLNVNKITDNKSFCKTVKPSLIKIRKNSTCWKRYNHFGRKRSCENLSVLFWRNCR